MKILKKRKKIPLSRLKNKRWFWIALLWVVLTGGSFFLFPVFSPYSLDKKTIAEILGEKIEASRLPASVHLEVDGTQTELNFEYTIQSSLQQEMEKLFKQYRPDYGAFVAMDANTGQILSLVSYHEGVSQIHENLALRASFPSASIFKVVTASAAIAEKKLSGETKIPFNGQNHTLYRGNVLKNQFNRWTRWMRLEDAFALSVNTVFGKLGIYELGPERLKEYAEKFYFNRPIPADLLVQEGRAVIDQERTWSLAETASGFTRENTMSPIHGAMIAAAIVNRGIIMEPFLVSKIQEKSGKIFYEAKPRIAGAAVDVATAEEMKKLMQATIQRGTSRASFSGFFRKRELKGLQVGGKTGSLSGKNPDGRTDWFVGYAEDELGHRVAVASMTIHREFWRVKSSYLARRAFEQYFGKRRSYHARTYSKSP